MNDPLSRRRFLLAVLAGALAAEGCRAAEDGAAGSLPLPPWLASLALDPAAAARLGRAYLATRAEENDPQLLLDALERAVASRGGAVNADFAALDRAVRADYAEGHFVQVEGWILSTTEARLYGFIALSRE